MRAEGFEQKDREWSRKSEYTKLTCGGFERGRSPLLGGVERGWNPLLRLFGESLSSRKFENAPKSSLSLCSIQFILGCDSYLIPTFNIYLSLFFLISPLFLLIYAIEHHLKKSFCMRNTIRPLRCIDDALCK